jgi:hypothetical protein
MVVDDRLSRRHDNARRRGNPPAAGEMAVGITIKSPPPKFFVRACGAAPAANGFHRTACGRSLGSSARESKYY